MDGPLEILNYLPITFPDVEDIKSCREYIDYLYGVYVKTQEGGFYQFSYLAYHMLFMSYIYKVIWMMHKLNMLTSQFEERRRQIIESASKPFDLSEISEKELISALKPLGFHSNRIKDVEQFVDRRDNCAHASGFVQYTESKIEQYINDEFEFIKEVDVKLKTILKNSFVNLPFEPGQTFYLQTESYIRESFLSLKDLGILANICLKNLKTPVTKFAESRKHIYHLVMLNTICNYNHDADNLFLQHFDKVFEIPIELLDTEILSELEYPLNQMIELVETTNSYQKFKELQKDVELMLIG